MAPRRAPVGSHRPGTQSQALAEFALVFPMAMMVIFAIIVFGMYVFYQQQITNVAREAARFAGIHSSTAACPTASWRDPPGTNRPPSYPEYPFHCDGPNNPNDAYPWPKMTDQARSFAWGVGASSVKVNACWSGYVPSGTAVGSYANYSAASGFPQADYPSVDNATTPPTPNLFVQCTIGGIDPVANADTLGCADRMTTAADDPASDIPGNQVTVYACFEWTPPLAGVLVIPTSVTMRAVITEVIQRQQ
jgi:TadE-like protein